MISQAIASELSFTFCAAFSEFDREQLLKVLTGMREPEFGKDWMVMGEPSQESYLYWESDCIIYVLEVGDKIWTDKTNWALCRYEYTSETLWKVKEFKSWEL